MVIATEFKFTQDYLKLEKEFTKYSNILSGIASLFTCSRCAECCKFEDNRGGPIITSFEYEHFGESNTIWSADNKVFLKNPCPFLVNNMCKTNAYKPRVCRMHPFSFHSEKPTRLAVYNCELGREILLNYLYFLRDVKKKNIPEIALQQVKNSEINGKCYSYIPYMEDAMKGFELLKEFLIDYKKKWKTCCMLSEIKNKNQGGNIYGEYKTLRRT